MFRYLLLFLTVCLIPAAAQQPPKPCDAPEARQMDFWLGDWELKWEGGHGTNKVTRVLDGCIIQENFRAIEGMTLVGRSVSAWDPFNKQWKQTWVDNNGGYLDFTGERDGDTMTLRRQFTRNGRTIAQRMVFRDITEDGFTWDWQSSIDDGATWRTNWQVEYTRR